MSKNIVLINGSYRVDGIISRSVTFLAKELEHLGCRCDIITLRNEEIHFCTNCRSCTQETGDQPATCVTRDGMERIIEKLENADGYVFASPTNMGTVTALFKQFMERLVVYAYWPWGAHTPKYRKEKAVRKPAVCIASSAMPGIMARLFTHTFSTMKFALNAVGSQKVGSLTMGMVAVTEKPALQEHHQKKLKKLAGKLVR